MISKISPNKTSIIYENVESLSFRHIDYANTIILPILVLFAIVTNTLSLVTLTQPNLKKKIFKYMFSMCLFDFYTLFSSFWLSLIRCGALCPYYFSYSYISKFYELYFYLFLANVSVFLSNVMDLHIAFNRLLSFSSSNRFSEKLAKIPFKWQFLSWTIISLILALPNYIITKSVNTIGYLAIKHYSLNGTSFNITYESLYQIQSNNLKSMKIAELILIVVSQVIYIAKPILLIVSCIANLVMGFKFKRFLNEKRKVAPIERSTGKLFVRIYLKYFYSFLNYRNFRLWSIN